MFTVHYKKFTYYLEFVHTIVDSGYDSRRDKVHRDSKTDCVISFKDPELGAVPLVTGTVKHKHGKDIFSLAMARKYALAKALAEMGSDVDVRKVFWLAYFDTFGSNKNAE